MAEGMRRVALGAIPWATVYPGVHRRQADATRMTLTVYRFEPAGRFPLHHHRQEQVVMVVEGAVTFAGAGQAVTLGPDEVLVIAPDVPHEAVAGPTGALVVSVVAPARRSATDYVVDGAG
ncbi:MAG: cupin domain-containing protein [Armatimonadota bacterium]|nr:cupin domain-containing protein [Armatimonadota bacterium]MDR7531874.1 cupin domain-containing protein [Armatimonadota bacterium]MDR7534781.1 cupin domain-containing protein [Armatimonadota bacterium]